MLFLYCRNGVSRDLVVAACVKANSWPEGLYIVCAQLVLTYTHLPEAFRRDEESPGLLSLALFSGCRSQSPKRMGREEYVHTCCQEKDSHAK